MHNSIKICFSDFWGLFNYEDNYFLRILKRKFNVEIDNENPDYVIYSTYGTNFLKYKRAIKILYIAENVRPNFYECDFSIGFDYETYKGRNLRYPLYVMYGFVPSLLEKKNPENILAEKNAFCNMVVSNTNSKKRIDFFKLLNARKRVDSGGKVLNNIGYLVDDKLDFIKNYRFSLAFENTAFPGYTTEKIFEPMKVNSIPIYWGNKRIGEEFNEKSFVNIHSFNRIKDAVDFIINIENDHNKLYKILSEPWFIDNKLPEYFDENKFCDFFEKFIFHKKPITQKFLMAKRQTLARLNVIRKKVFSKAFDKPYCHVS